MATKKTRKKPASKRISGALVRWLKKQNPAMRKATSVRVQRLKGGVIKLTPLRRNITEGFYSGGVFHPIRAASDYDPGRAGEGRLPEPRRRSGKKKGWRY
jgi:hypothetical protein